MSKIGSDSGPRFHTTDEPDVVSYHVISKLAVVSAVFGLLSFTATLHPLMLIAPIVAVVTGALALRAIATDTAGLTGRRLAIAGMIVGVFFAATATSRLMTRDWIIATRAKKFAGDWLQLAIDGRREEAYEMTLAPERRQLPTTDLPAYYAGSPERNEHLQRFYDESPMKELIEFGTAGTVRLDRIVDTLQDHRSRDIVGLIYSLEYVDGDTPHTLKIRLVLRRSRHPRTGRGQWVVWQVGDPADPEDQV
jgi:hypothetical protein